jgi:hypothetical protein
MSQQVVQASVPVETVSTTDASATTTLPVQDKNTCIEKLDTIISDLSNCVINTPTDVEKKNITDKLDTLDKVLQEKKTSLGTKKMFGWFGGKKSKKSKKSKSKTKKQRR